jgi:hypothetical protein
VMNLIFAPQLRLVKIWVSLIPSCIAGARNTARKEGEPFRAKGIKQNSKRKCVAYAAKWISCARSVTS